LNESPTLPRLLTFTGAAGTFPAWLWRALTNAQRDAGRDGIPVVIAQDGLRKSMILDVDDWSDALSTHDRPHNRT